ncbi:hypothetical protein GCM10010413_55220 [Promicromonospora sukumoe]
MRNEHLRWVHASPLRSVRRPWCAAHAVRILTQQYHDLVNSDGVIIGAQVNHPLGRETLYVDVGDAPRSTRVTIRAYNAMKSSWYISGCFTLTRVRTGALAPASERPEVWP